MTIIAALPLDLNCRCGHHLLQAVINMGVEGQIGSHDLVVDHVDVICPSCRRHLRTAEDDLTRALKAMGQQ